MMTEREKELHEAITNLTWRRAALECYEAALELASEDRGPLLKLMERFRAKGGEKHYHVAGMNMDLCALCDRDLRDPVHRMPVK